MSFRFLFWNSKFSGQFRSAEVPTSDLNGAGVLRKFGADLFLCVCVCFFVWFPSSRETEDFCAQILCAQIFTQIVAHIAAKICSAQMFF